MKVSKIYSCMGIIRVVLFFSILACPSLFAGGKPDPVFVKSEELIKEKKYNEAIKLLSDFAKTDDVRFDNAQAKIRKIMKLYDEYNKNLEKLAGILETNPNDFISIIDITRRLKRIDAPRDDEVRFFVERAYEMARFAIYSTDVERILKEGRSLLNANEYVAAMNKYQSGFQIYERDMKEAGFGTQIEADTQRTLNNISAAIENSEQVAAQIRNINNLTANIRMGQNSAQNRQILDSAIAVVTPYLDRLIEIKTEFARAQEFFELTEELPRIGNSNEIGAAYFPAAALFMRGRVNESVREGVMGSIDALWNGIIHPLKTAYYGIEERLYQSAMTSTESGNYVLARANIAAAKEFFGNYGAIINKSEAFAEIDSRFKISNFNLHSSVKESIAAFEALNNSLDYFSSAENIGTRFAQISGSQAEDGYARQFELNKISVTESLRVANDTKKEYDVLRAGIRSNIASISSRVEELEKQRPSGGVVSEAESPLKSAIRYYADSRRIMEKLDAGIFGGETSRIQQLYAAADERAAENLENAGKIFAEAVKLMDGVDIRTEQGQEVKAKYPREAAAFLNSMEENIAPALQISGELAADYRQGASDPDFAKNFKRYNDAASEYIRKLNELESERAARYRTARDQADRAAGLQIDGERLIRDSRQALNAENFELANELLLRTVSRFTESLELQENPALRREWQLEVDPLDKEIASLEYDYIIREVRDLINTSRDRYFTGNFDNAESFLVHAETRWARVRTDANSEIAYWLNLVRTAMSMRTGTNVPITAPLYPEVSQLLSDANKNYDDGVSLFMSSMREEAAVKFTNAREKTREVKLVYPINQEALLIELRIDKIIDPESFDSRFRQQFASAAAGAKNGSRESYLELENLSKINPNYRGMQEALLEAKYELGILQRPVGSSVVNESASLSAQARRLFASGAAANAQEVLRLTARALALNPSNTEAMQLADRARISSQRQSAITGGQSDEQLYFEAVREFTRGNNIIAMTIVERLLRNPANRNNVRFNELSRRISATL